jgi:D-alanyl-lipoteichoic acid acyltransferase DltB (MBOAT superfamily)
MNFISLSYLLFLPVVALLWYLVPGRAKRPVLLAASWAFYLCWAPVYGLFLLFSTLSTYICALLIAKKRTKLWPALTLILNLGMLLVFKYTGFFLSAGSGLLRLVGVSSALPRPELLLPVGISFYTFQAVGYVIDVWRGDVEPERNVVDYALFVSFFPQIASGPIGRAGRLLPQLTRPVGFIDENLKRGVLRIIWGMAKKLLIADHLAVIVNAAFGDVFAFSDGQLAVAAICYTFQIYCDFSSYTDIAVGSARLLGIELDENFRSPYLARSLRDFWRRWHISLSTWFRDYLYIPLGGSSVKTVRRCLNLLIVFAVSGLWHGAAFTFVVWGLVHGLLQVFGVVLKPLRERLYRVVLRESFIMKAVSLIGTFILVAAAWVFFRAESVSGALYVLGACGRWLTHLSLPDLTAFGLDRVTPVVVLVFWAALVASDILREKFDLSAFFCRRDVLRYALYFVLIAAALLYGYYGNAYDPQDFLYFKF